jgi:hypothetical protein
MSYQAAILLLCGAASIVSAGAQPPAETRETASITERELRSDLQALAGDETGGRATASTGYMLAATRAVERLKAAGVKPAFTDAQGREGWFQPVPLDRIVTGPDTCLRLSRTKDSVEFRHGKGMLVLYPGPGTRVVTGEPVFVGFTRRKRVGMTWPASTCRDGSRSSWQARPAPDAENPICPPR